MAYIIVNDGYPDSGEFDNNRIWFDERDPADRQRALLQAQRRREHLARRRAGPPPRDDAPDPNAADVGGADAALQGQTAPIRKAISGIAGALALMQACAVPAGTPCDERAGQRCAQGEDSLRAQADEASAKPVPPAGYTVKWSTCTHFVEGDARILNNSRVVIVADDGTVPIMRVEPLGESKDDVRRVAVAELRNEGLLRGEGVLRDDRVSLGEDPGALRPTSTATPIVEVEAPQQVVSFLKLGQVVVTKEPNGSILQWVISSDDLGDPVMNETTGKLEYQDTCFRNPKTAGHDTLGYIAPGTELAPSCLVESVTQSYNAYSAYGYLPLMNFANLIVPTGNDPAHNALPEIYATYLGFNGNSHSYTGLGAALNDINGTERDRHMNYYPYAAPFEPTPVPVEEPIVVDPL